MGALFEQLPPLSLRNLSISDNLIKTVEKVQYNFDQIYMHGGGPKGDKGDIGEKGLPGATGIGTQGPQGESGAQIYFVQTTLTNGQTTIDPSHQVNDIVIDSDGSYFKVEEVLGNLQYSFQFNINSASLTNAYWLDQKAYYTAPIETNPMVNEHILFNPGDASGTEKNLVVARRSDNTGGFDKSEYYRIMLGLDEYPAIANQNVTSFISNIPHSSTAPAGDQFFAQIGFKYRNAHNANVGANTVWVIYKEEVANTRYLFSVTNLSTGIVMKHDTTDVNNSVFHVKGKNVSFIGNSVGIDTITEEMKFTIDASENVIYNTNSIKITNGTGTGSIFTVDNFESSSIVSNVVGLTPLSGTLVQIVTAFNDMKFLAIGADIELEATDVTLDASGDVTLDASGDIIIKTTDIITDGVDTIDITNADTRILSSDDSVARIEIATRYQNRIELISSGILRPDAAGEIDISGVDRPVISVGRKVGDPIGTYSVMREFTNGENNQFIIIKASEGILIEDYTVAGGNIDLEGGVLSKKLLQNESLLLWRVGSGNYLQVGDTFSSTEKSGVKTYNWNTLTATTNINVIDTPRNLVFDGTTITVVGGIDLVFNNIDAKEGSMFFLDIINLPSWNPTRLINIKSGASIIKTFTKFDHNISDGGDGMKIAIYFNGSSWKIIGGGHNTLTGISGNPHNVFWGDGTITNSNFLAST